MKYKSELAILKKELIEHKGSFFIAPAILSSIFFVLLLMQGLFGSHGQLVSFADEALIASYMSNTIFFAIYMGITLFFYYADAFSADRKNNSLLFWKSMPISDLKILGLKFIVGTLVVPIVILGWIMIGSVLSYLIGVINIGSFGEFIAPWTVILFILKLASVTLIMLLVVMLWLTPFYAWVAFLSVFFKKWSIALAFVIPLVLIVMEEIIFFDGLDHSFIGSFLSQRLVEIFDMTTLAKDSQLHEMDNINFDFEDAQRTTSFANIVIDKLYSNLWQLLSHVKWVSLMGGLIISGVFVYVGSEYRRRFIQG